MSGWYTTGRRGNWLTDEFMRRKNRERQMPNGSMSGPMMWSTQIDGPVLVRFQGREKNTEGTEQLRVYLDIRNILSIEQMAEGGSTVILTGGIYHDLYQSATDVIERIRQAAEEMGLR